MRCGSRKGETTLGMMNETQNEQQRVLMIAAHPDDPEFGCAGTVAKWAAAGREITYLLLTSGDKGSPSAEIAPGRLALVREEEQRAAAKVLGVAEVVFWGYPDAMLEYNMELRRRLCWALRKYRPHVLLTIDPWRHYQLHPDHRVAGQSALDAIYAAREWHIFPEQLRDGVVPWRVREAYLFWTGDPDYYEDITACFERRLEALARHESQLLGKAEQATERLRQLAREAGERAGCEYAEGFRRFEFPQR